MAWIAEPQRSAGIYENAKIYSLQTRPRKQPELLIQKQTSRCFRSYTDGIVIFRSCDIMCYGVYISTDSSEDLARRNSELVRFEKVTDPSTDPCIRLLDFPNQWYIGSKSGCSCTFRHLASIELGFSEPEDWCKEEQDELDATLELYSILAFLLSAGHKVDLVDRWEGSGPEDIKTLDVSLDDVSEKAFRMFENHKFRFKKGKTQQNASRLPR